MKKLVGLIAAALLATGLVAASSVSASADPYPGTVRTWTHASGVDASHAHVAKVFVKVTAREGRPHDGSLSFTLVKGDGETFTFQRGYDGAQTYRFEDLPGGRYTAVVTYQPSVDSKYKPSTDSAKVRVKPFRG